MKSSFFGGKIFSIFEQACFRNENGNRRLGFIKPLYITIQFAWLYTHPATLPPPPPGMIMLCKSGYVMCFLMFPHNVYKKAGVCRDLNHKADFQNFTIYKLVF